VHEGVVASASRNQTSCCYARSKKPWIDGVPLRSACGTAFLLAAAVGFGIMAAKLAGGNKAIALLSKYTAERYDPWGADPHMGAAFGRTFQAAVSLAFARRGLPWWGFAGFYIASQGLGGRVGVRAAKIMCELPARQ
jgi:hypothetical protein